MVVKLLIKKNDLFKERTNLQRSVGLSCSTFFYTLNVPSSLVVSPLSFSSFYSFSFLYFSMFFSLFFFFFIIGRQQSFKYWCNPWSSCFETHPSISWPCSLLFRLFHLFFMVSRWQVTIFNLPLIIICLSLIIIFTDINIINIYLEKCVGFLKPAQLFWPKQLQAKGTRVCITYLLSLYFYCYFNNTY